MWVLKSFGTSVSGISEESLETLVTLKREDFHFSVGPVQILEMFIFNALGLYLIYLYFTLAYCNPGRIESRKEKQFINERFERLFTELRLQKEERAGEKFTDFQNCIDFLPRTRRT